MALLSVLCSLFGCGKAPAYTADDIRSVSISCGHMDYSHSYSFYLRKDESGWLLDAEFATDTENPRVEYEECPVEEEDVKELLDIVVEQDLIERLWRCKKSKVKVQILDETTYYSSIGFTDGESLGAAILISKDMEARLYRLAGKYAGTVSETNKYSGDTAE